VGIGGAHLGLDLLLGMKPKDVPRLDSVGINSVALAFTLAVSVLAGIFVWTVSGTAIVAAKLGGRAAHDRKSGESKFLQHSAAAFAGDG
jgi:hypothetical protein